VSLLDALIEDQLSTPPAIVGSLPKREIWICVRWDGAAQLLFGSGTQDDPYDGSNDSKFDAVMDSLPQNALIHVGPGTFETKGGSGNGHPFFGFQPKPGWRIVGSGMFQTTLKLVNAAGIGQGIPIIGAPFTGTADVEIHLSTTTASANALGSTFANNIGADETVVLQQQVLPLSSGPVNPGGPNSFSVVILLPTKFRYDPAKGNLLLDASVRGVARLSNLDWDTSLNDGVSTVIGDLGMPTGVVSSSGLVTRFTFEVVPEPSELLCFVFGGAIILFIRL
jgi:hypothetical protein